MGLTPTTLYLFGMPMPKYMDGRVLGEIFKRDSEFTKREVRDSSYEEDVIKR